MSQPKTVKDRYDYTDPIPEEDGRAEGECWCFYPNNPVLDYHIISGTECVAAGLEDAAKAACAKVREQDDGESRDCHDLPGFYSWENCTEEGREQWREVARAVLEAAGIEVVDEVVEVKNEDGHIQHAAHKDDAEYSYIDLVPGDRVFVKRKED